MRHAKIDVTLSNDGRLVDVVQYEDSLLDDFADKCLGLHGQAVGDARLGAIVQRRLSRLVDGQRANLGGERTNEEGRW